MEVRNTHDLYEMMGQIKEWAREHGADELCEAINEADKAPTASELIYSYGDVLQQFRDRIPRDLPQDYRKNWDHSIELATAAIDV